MSPLIWRRVRLPLLLVCAGVFGACAPPGVVQATRPVLDAPPRPDPYPREPLLEAGVDGAGCRLPEGAETAGGRVFPGGTGLRGDPDFAPTALPDTVRCWYEELWSVLQDPTRSAYYTRRSDANDLYVYAREINTHVSAVLTALRVTGDLALLDEVDRLAQHMRAQLEDRWQRGAAFDAGSVDGYLNWVWNQSTSDQHRGRDIHQVDEMRTHALVAQLAWAYSVNQDLPSPNGVDYAERAAFWTDYLRNHFEAKWRERNDAPWPEFPFLAMPHVHETVDFIRYHHYLHLLTGEEAYEQEARRLTGIILDNFAEVETDAGPALVTPRSILANGGSQDYLLPATYVRYVYASAVDLHMEEVGAWADDALMEKLARGLAEFIIDNGATDFARDIGGGVERGGIPASEKGRWARFSPGRYNISPYALLSPWDGTGEVAEVSREVYAGIGKDQRGVFIPVAMLLDAAYGRVAY